MNLVLPNSRTVDFKRLTHTEQLAAIRRLAADGFGDLDVSAVTDWPLDLVRSAPGPSARTWTTKADVVIDHEGFGK